MEGEFLGEELVSAPEAVAGQQEDLGYMAGKGVPSGAKGCFFVFCHRLVSSEVAYAIWKRLTGAQAEEGGEGHASRR